MPISAFWTISKNAERVDAYEHLKLTDLQASMNNPDSLKDFRERLNKRMGDFVKTKVLYDETRDETGFAELKAMM